MITPEERKQLRKILGNTYTPEVKKALKDNNLKDYSLAYIRRVLNEGIENPDIEMCIWKVASVKKQNQLEIENAKKSILKK